MGHIPEPERTPLGPAYEGRLLDRPDDEVVDQGAGFDIRTLVSRRGMLSILGIGVGTVALAACAPAATGSSTATAEGEIPEETNGPYPADGSNGPNILEESGIVRSDITSSLDGGTTVDGVPLEFTFTVTDMAKGGVPFAGAAVYAWQCDAQGLYSMYSAGAENETYLRGIQVAGSDGTVTFQTIVPGCYAGRWTHIHFEVYPDAGSATDHGNAIATSQVAFPADMLADVYALDSYPGSARNLAQVGTSAADDGIFADSWQLETATISGSAGSGYVGSLAVGVDTGTTGSAGGMGGGGGQSGRGGQRGPGEPPPQP